MTYRPGMHIYLASGFFNETQRDLCDFVEEFETSYLPIYSPRRDGGVLKPDASKAERKEIFMSNVYAIKNSIMVLAVIDDFDPGVIWEMGYAYGKHVPILAYSDVEGRGLNVMLAGAANLGFLNGRGALGVLLTEMASLSQNDLLPMEFTAFPFNTWPGEIQ